MKTCSKCNVTKPLGEFQRRKDSTDGYRDQCRSCRLIIMANYRRANITELRAYDRARQQRDRIAKAEYLRRYYHENIEKRRAYLRANPEGNRLNQRRRKARKRAYKMQPEDREYMKVLLRDPCCYCGSTGGTIDHIEALSLRGDGEWLNLTSACHACNSSKNVKALLGFLLARPQLAQV